MKLSTKITSATGSALLALATQAGVVMAAVPEITVDPGTGYATNFGAMFSSFLNIVMLIAAVLVFAFLIMGGIEWITSGGDKNKAESARNKITSAVIGLVIVAASYAIVNLVVQFLGFDNFNDVFNNIGTINQPA